MVKYKVDHYWEPRIEKVEVEKESGSSVWIRGRREAKETQYHAFFNTFQEAKDHLIDVFSKKAQEARLRLDLANGYLGNAKGLKEV